MNEHDTPMERYEKMARELISSGAKSPPEEEAYRNVKQPPKSTSLVYQLDSLEKVLDETHKVAELLECRLQPILCPADAERSTSVPLRGEHGAGFSPVSLRVVSLTDSVNRLRERLVILLGMASL